MRIDEVVKRLSDNAKIEASFKSMVEEAFILGLWYKQFPEYMLDHIEKAYSWDYDDLFPELSDSGWNWFDSFFQRPLKFNFIAETADSWHQLYRDMRALGWKRLKVKREGGVLQYILEITRDGMPQGYQTLHLLLNITLQTCKTVQVGTKMVEQPIYETKCEDIKDIEEVEAEEVLGDDNSKPEAEAESEAEPATAAAEDDIPF